MQNQYSKYLGVKTHNNFPLVKYSIWFFQFKKKIKVATLNKRII
jgi:hypothetical protein